MSRTTTTSMNIFSLLFRRAPNIVFLTIALDALSGIAYAMLIPLVLGSIRTGEDAQGPADVATKTVLSFEVINYRHALVFAAAVVFILMTRTTSRILMKLVVSNVTAALRIAMYERLVQAPVAEVERAGRARVMAVLTEDVPWIVAAGRLFPTMLSHLGTLAGMLTYLLYLNMNVFWFVIQALIVGAITYQLPMFIGLRFLRRKREFVDKLHESVRALLDGFKELKLNRRKRATFFRDDLYVNEYGVRDSDRTGDAVLTVAGIYGDLINFFVIGAISFVFINYHAVSAQDLIAVIMTLLYITAPVASILQAVPQYMTAGVSLRKVNQLFFDMPIEAAKLVYEPVVPWSRLRFENVVYRHPGTGQRQGYVVGPVSFEIAKGEITFIAGGNGSGKSTLSKLITLHYSVAEGHIYFGDTRISGDTLNIYRQHIAFIYSDYHLFERLLGEIGEHTKKRVDGYLDQLGLKHKTTFENGRFSDLDLSDGQRRRLALLVTFVEDKDLYLFDEWAADQDPVFKDVFYYKILPELKREGKAVVVVSHDDRYFHIADNLLFMENGRLVNAPESARSKHMSGAVKSVGT